MEQNDHIERLQQQINQIIGVESTLKRRKKTTEDAQREIFLNTIPLLEHIVDRNSMLSADYGIDMSKYDESFFKIIDSLIYLHFGKEAGDLIMFYIYDRMNPDGTMNELMDENNQIIQINKIEDLWELVKSLKNNNASS
jgi:hypothetical protein